MTLGVLSTLSFLGLTGPRSAILIFLSYGLISQITHLAVLDLAARSCPARVEGNGVRAPDVRPESGSKWVSGARWLAVR